MRKTYGKYQEKKCAFCGETAVHYNEQRIPVCKTHKNFSLKVENCNVCGGMAEIKHGKYGAFIICMNCGPVNLNKHLSLKK